MKIVTIIICSIALLAAAFSIYPVAVLAQGEITAYFFYSETCEHCQVEARFWDQTLPTLSSVILREYEVGDAAAANAAQAAGQKLGVTVRGVPLTIIGSRVIEGYTGDQIQGEQIRQIINKYQTEGGYTDMVAPLVAGIAEKPHPASVVSDDPAATVNLTGTDYLVDIPGVGAFDVSSLSLPLTTILLGLLDGFNPCALWILLFLISLIIPMRNRGRGWFYGIIFLMVSGAVYYVFMAAWLNIFLFIGMSLVVRLFIGAAALVAGGWQLRRFQKHRDSGCDVIVKERRKKLIDRLTSIITSENFGYGLLGIIAIAASVNLFELMCSAGLPALYTKLLSLAELPHWQYYLYLLGYVLCYMLDDLIIFIIAMLTVRLTGITTRYERWVALAGGIIMILVGLLLIFRPSWLTLAF